MALDRLFDLGGHFRSGTGGARPRTAYPQHDDHLLDRVNFWARRADALITTGDADLRSSLMSQCSETCSDCGASVGFRCTGDTIVAETVCPYPDGLPAFDVVLDVPSGEIVFANDFRGLVPLMGADNDHYINHTSEMKRCTTDYAEAGMIHVYVGNSCPNLRKLQDGTLRVQDRGARPGARGRKLGYISTDLWWFSAMDAQEFQRRCDEFQALPEHFNPIRVRVEPGAWSFSVDYNQSRDQPRIYSHARRTGPCTGWMRPQDPFLNPSTFEDSHFWAAWQNVSRKYQWEFSNFVEHAFCVLGNGLDWSNGRLTHEKRDPPAFPKLDDMDTHVGPLDRDIPLFQAEVAYGDRKHGIYPMSLGSFPNQAASMPWNVDIHWLAVGLVLFQGLARAPQVLSHRSPAEHATQIQVVGKTLTILNAIATRGDHWPRLAEVFADMAPVWEMLNAVRPVLPKRPAWLDALRA